MEAALRGAGDWEDHVTHLYLPPPHQSLGPGEARLGPAIWDSLNYTNYNNDIISEVSGFDSD